MILKSILLLLCATTCLSSPLQPAQAPALGRRDESEDYLPARVPYIFPPPGTDPVADAIRARRENGTLLALDGVLLNAPLIASTWNSLFGVIRVNTTIPGNMRELAILRIATLNKASYEWIQHEPVGRSEGLTTEQLRVIRLSPLITSTTEELTAEASNTLGPLLSAMLVFTDLSTATAQVPDVVFDELRKFLNNQQLVEATATVGGYNFVSRFLLALDVGGDNNLPVPIPS